jgi:hypothetical protein
MPTAIVYCGSRRETEVAVEPVDRGCGAGEIACLECRGTGVWAFAEPEIPAGPCVDCKGTGRVLVSIA